MQVTANGEIDRICSTFWRKLSNAVLKCRPKTTKILSRNYGHSYASLNKIIKPELSFYSKILMKLPLWEERFEVLQYQSSVSLKIQFSHDDRVKMHFI
jgi:hypothetical protein